MSKTHTNAITRRIPGIIRHDFPRKLIALLFALLVWVSVNNEIGVEGKVPEVEVNFTLPDSLILLNDDLPKVTLKIEASEKRKDQLTPSDFKIEKSVKLESYKPGELLTIGLSPSNVKGPNDVKIKKLVPNRVTIEVDRKSTKVIDIKPKFEGKLHPNYSLDKVQIIPNKTKITGPMTIVKKIKFLYTTPIPLDGVVSSFDRSVTVANNNPSITISGRKNAQVTIDVFKLYETRQFRSIPIRVLTPEDTNGLRVVLLSTPHTDIFVEGAKNVVDKMLDSDIKAFIDVSNRSDIDTSNLKLEYTAEVDAWITKTGVSIISISPKVVRFKLAKIIKE